MWPMGFKQEENNMMTEAEKFSDLVSGLSCVSSFSAYDGRQWVFKSVDGRELSFISHEFSMGGTEGLIEGLVVGEWHRAVGYLKADAAFRAAAYWLTGGDFYQNALG